ncbi:MAG: hypothetical protein H6981_14680 [Gammaproteobacteria bacterium]|nr:hypothetical protein [Gammaproteobacteria bacterium]MCP5138029.1 hypothetical protein [Gammaproteobacteria bacterium]
MDDDRKTYQRRYRQGYKGQAKRVNLTLSLAEHRAFARAANKEQKKLASYIKELAIAGLDAQAHIPEALQAELKTLRFAVLNIANNVNQIAHRSNTLRELSQSEENNLLGYLKQLDDVVRRYTAGRILSHPDDHDH